MIKYTDKTKFTGVIVALVGLLLLTLPAFAQKNLEGAQKNYIVNINTPDGYARITILNNEPKIKVTDKAFYYWYAYGKMMSTMGGYDGHLLNGLYTCFYGNNNLKEKGYFNKGLKAGSWTEWFENGQIKEESNWCKGLRNGLTLVYDENGDLKCEENYKDGIYNGVVILYQSGQIVSKKNYRKGVERISKTSCKTKDSINHKESDSNAKADVQSTPKSKKNILQKVKDLFVKGKQNTEDSSQNSNN